MSRPLLAMTTASARDSLRQAVGQPWREPAEIGTALANMSASITAIDQVLAGLALRLLQPGTEVESVDGPFRGDTPAAAATTGLWLARAAGLSSQLRACLDNAHIAAAGLAAPTERSG
ncbi:hypothetical protein [Amycolatopsis sp. PS_44_ISF1]|uniref:hypothetical protein n=1 Tax=Amycolatopsis sp. PS_44_ISF1 TaxID=2974917 RepID=UPI0028DE5C62|nr:hypothetical protein [Amycolatopsis sp. PS_44_ISF1]MDT8912376.1 hypothetical protein [Amycolatopsis sp. PS_44_ISF1]